MTDKPYIIKEGLIVEGSIQADNLALEGVSLEDLLDVNISTPPSNLQALVYNSSQSKWVPNTISYVADLDDLTDVDLTTTPPTEGQALVWNSTEEAFVPGDVTINSIDDITDVRLNANQAPSDGRALIYQNGEFISGPVIGGVSYEPQGGEPNYDTVELLMNFNGADLSTVFTDQSPSPKTVTSVGTPTISTSQSKFGGSSLYLNGTTSSLEFTPILFDSNEDFTVECFIYTAVTNDAGILGSSVAGNWQMFCLLNDKLSAYWNGIQFQGAITVPQNEWVHVAMTRASGTVRLFVNGVMESTTYTGNTTSLQFAKLGYANYRNRFNGYIDSVRISRLARYTSTFTVPTVEFPTASSDLITIPYSIGNHDDVDIATNPPADGDALVWSEADNAFVPGSVGGGSTIDSIDDIADVNLSANQASSDGRALIYQNGEWIAGPTIGGYSYEAGGDLDFATTRLLAKFQGTPGNSNFVDSSNISGTMTVVPLGGVAFSSGQVRTGSSSAFFDGTDDQITYTSSSTQSIGTSNYTIEAWFYVTAAPGDQKAIVSFEQNGFNCVMSLRPNLGIQFYLGAGGAFAIGGATTGTALLNQWNHAAVVRNGNAYTVYINGLGTSIGSASNVFPDYTIIRIGNESEGLIASNSFFSGYIDSVRFSTIARYTADFTPAPSAFPGLPTTISLPYSINNLDDIDISTNPPADGDALVWSEADNAFMPGSVNGGASALAAIPSLGVPKRYWRMSGFSTEALVGNTLDLTEIDFYIDGVEVVPIGASSNISWYGGSTAVLIDGVYNETSSRAFHGAWSSIVATAYIEFDFGEPIIPNGMKITSAYSNQRFPASFTISSSDTAGSGFAGATVNSGYTFGALVSSLSNTGIFTLLNGIADDPDLTSPPSEVVLGYYKKKLYFNQVTSPAGWKQVPHYDPDEAIADGDTLVWSETDNTFVPGNVSGGASALADLTDVDITTNPPAEGELLGWSSAEEAFVPVPRPAELGAQTLINTATDLAADAASDFTLTAGATSLLLAFTASYPCWIRVYGTAAARTADTRTAPGGTPPLAGSDFYAEVATSAPEQTIKFSPVPTLQGDSGSMVYIRAVNMDTVTRTIDMEFSILTLEA